MKRRDNHDNLGHHHGDVPSNSGEGADRRGAPLGSRRPYVAPKLTQFGRMNTLISGFGGTRLDSNNSATFG